MRSALVLAALTACAPPDFVTGNGVAVYRAGDFLHPDELAEIEALTVETAAARWDVPADRAAEELQGVVVSVHPDPVLECPAGSPERLACYGLEREPGLVDLATRWCAYHSAYGHEIMHHLQARLGHADDPDHLDPVWAAVIQNDKWITANGAHRDRCHRP